MTHNPLSDLLDETFDYGLVLSQNNSNSYQNPMDNNIFMSSSSSPQQLLNQNDHFISPRSYHPSNTTCLNGQLGLGQVLSTEVRRTYVTPNRVQIDHHFIDYSPMQNQVSFPPNQVIGISEVTKTTRFLAPTSTLERLFAPNFDLPTPNLLRNNSFNIQGQLPKFNNLTTIPTNYSSTKIDHINLAKGKGVEVLDDHKQLSAFASLLSKGKSKTTPMINDQNPNACDQSSGNGKSQNVESDGRTHSLPCKKFGPYKCPRCIGVFSTSQAFAAHMLSHYKSETSDERKARLAARYKKRNLRVVHSSDGLTLMPPDHHSSNAQRKKVCARKGKGHGKAKIGVEVEDEVEKEGKDAHSTNGDVEKIKEEIVEENSVGNAM